MTVAALTLAMMSGGVLAGMNSAYQDDTSNPGTPDSAMVGSSGAVGKRFAVVTASPRSWPVRTVCSSEPVVLNMRIDAAGDGVGNGAGRRLRDRARA